MGAFVSQAYSSEYQPDLKRQKMDPGIMGGQFDGACDEGSREEAGERPAHVRRKKAQADQQKRRLPQLDGDFDAYSDPLDELLRQPLDEAPVGIERGSITQEGRDLDAEDLGSD